MTDIAATRLPTYFISHGGGPWPWMKDLMPMDLSTLEASLQQIPHEIGVRPRAVLAVSAHWVAPEFTIQTHPSPPMVYDYGGFPDFTYHIQYPAPGSPEVARRVVELLNGAAITVRQDPQRGFDHGVYAPLYAAYPDADVPVLQLSIKHGYDPGAHLAAGRALAPLRDEGVLIVGSGLSYHNMRRMGPDAKEPSQDFDRWLNTTLAEGDPLKRNEALLHWDQAPSARIAHPAEDHLIPLMVAVGAAERDPAIRTYHEETFAGAVTASSFRFGQATASAI